MEFTKGASQRTAAATCSMEVCGKPSGLVFPRSMVGDKHMDMSNSAGDKILLSIGNPINGRRHDAGEAQPKTGVADLVLMMEIFPLLKGDRNCSFKSPSKTQSTSGTVHRPGQVGAASMKRDRWGVMIKKVPVVFHRKPPEN